jgi:hypothetical protein
LPQVLLILVKQTPLSCCFLFSHSRFLKLHHPIRI